MGSFKSGPGERRIGDGRSFDGGGEEIDREG